MLQEHSEKNSKYRRLLLDVEGQLDKLSCCLIFLCILGIEKNYLDSGCSVSYSLSSWCKRHPQCRFRWWDLTAEIFFGKTVLGQRSQLFQTIEWFCKSFPFLFFYKITWKTTRSRRTLITFAIMQIIKRKKKRNDLNNKAVSKLTQPKEIFKTTDIPCVLFE